MKRSSRVAIALLVMMNAAMFCHAADSGTVDETVGTAPTPSILGQATEATAGRIFGVEGDASQIKYHEIEFTSHTPGSAATRSLLIPGWGQYFNHQKAKGTVFFLATAGTLIASVHLYRKADRSYDEYTAIGDKDGSKYDDYKRDHDRAIIFGSAAAILWVTAIFDAYHNAYKPLYSSAPTMDVAFLKDGAEVRLKKTF
jgi:hypothetical protein